MRVVIDSSELFSVVISGAGSKAFEIIEKYNLQLFTPEECLFEFKKHEQKLRKFGKDFESRTFLAFSLVRVVPSAFYEDRIPEAYNIASKFDEKDTPFIALTLKLNIPIWTNDRDMIKYGLISRKYVALDTAALKEMLEGKNLEDIVEEVKKKYVVNRM